jgi:hypothetical protein
MFLYATCGVVPKKRPQPLPSSSFLFVIHTVTCMGDLMVWIGNWIYSSLLVQSLIITTNCNNFHQIFRLTLLPRLPRTHSFLIGLPLLYWTNWSQSQLFLYSLRVDPIENMSIAQQWMSVIERLCCGNVFIEPLPSSGHMHHNIEYITKYCILCR